METRLTRRPGEPGTKKLLARFGERLVRVRYLYDAENGRRLKTVELVVESVPWKPQTRAPGRRDEDIVAVRIRYEETELRERARRLGAVWRLRKDSGKSAGRTRGAWESPTGLRLNDPCALIYC